MNNLHKLPHFDDTLGYLYIGHAVIDKSDAAVAAHFAGGKVHIPAASLSVLLLGPGTTITQAAVAALADNNCPIIWCGEEGVRFYAAGLGASRSSRALLRQATLVTRPDSRLNVVRRLYEMRFKEPLAGDLDLQQVRGMEGIRVRNAYAAASQQFGVPWRGRSYNRQNWADADPVNRAISAGNQCLYGLVHAAILSLGYSPALGFIHTGKQLSFVYDIADLYKMELVVPLAFGLVAGQEKNIEQGMRHACRNYFHEERLLRRIVPDIQRALDVKPGDPFQDDPYADDPAMPAEWWTPPTAKGLAGEGEQPPQEKEGEDDGPAT